MRKKLLFIFLGVILSVTQVIAQQINVTGEVTSLEDGSSIPGVSVLIKGTKTGVQTGADGRYSIQTKRGDVLQFIYVGTTLQEKTVGSAFTIDVVLAVDNNVLKEVVVVGYGTQKKESLTGAITSVNVEKVFGNRPITDVGRGLQGAVPGLSVVVPSGEVGSDPIIKIRGQVGSVLGNSNPLILVDNV